ncbi:MAG: PTS IIA-like nitrogen regulatory protein PtsN [Pseudomonadota bacterium]|nr:PTS IIA-like nitrogen regulatory protein PtsN [Pseudomonadota bacterium]
MQIQEILSTHCVFASLNAKSKKQVLEELAGKASGATGVSGNKVFETLLERERLGTTGVGGGIAIPHGKVEGLDRLLGFFARLEDPIEFESIDDKPVDLIFLLLAPMTGGTDHLKALAKISRLLRDHTKCDKLRAEASPERLYYLLTREAGAIMS